MADFLDEKRREIASRLKELEPLVQEHDRLRAALDALDGVGGRGARGASSSTPAASGRGRRGAGARSGGGGGRGRPRGTGTRSKEALELVRTRPGISIPEMAEAMGIKQNYLYRVLPGLQKDGLVRKDGPGLACDGGGVAARDRVGDPARIVLAAVARRRGTVRQHGPLPATTGSGREARRSDYPSRPSCWTASRSSLSSCTVRSIRSRAKSPTSRPWAIS